MGRVNNLAGLLTYGSSLGWAFPPVWGQWPMSASLAAYSCGGSCGLGSRAAPHSLFTGGCRTRLI